MQVRHISLFSNLVEIEPDIIYSPTASDEEIIEFITIWKIARNFAVDIETFGEDETAPLDPWRGHIRTIQIGLKNGRVLIADLGGWEDDREAFRKRLERLEFFEVLKQKIESKEVWSVAHNMMFELQWFIHKYGYKPWKCADTMLLSQIYWAGIQQYKHSLKAVCGRLDIEIDKTEQKSDWGWPLTNEQINYAAKDVRVLFPVWDKLALMCVEAGLTNSVNAEFGALPAFAEMSVYGFPVDKDLLTDIQRQYQEAAVEIERPFKEVFPDMTVDENLKLPDAIKERLGIDITKLDKNGNPIKKADKDALNPFRDNPVISSLLTTRSIGAYLDYLNNMQLAYRDGSVRGGFRQCAPQGRGRSTSGRSDYSEAEDGKKSSTKQDNGIPSVNLQNPPNPSKACPEIAALNLPPIRSAFRPQPGYKLLVVDLSAAHARIGAESTQDQLFIASYNEGIDVHGIVASKLSELVGKNWTKEDIATIRKQKGTPDGDLATTLRNISKNVFYGWLNGAGAFKTKETINIGGYQCEIEFAKEILDLLGVSFPGIKAFHDKIKEQIRTNIIEFPGCALPYTWATGISGRRVFLPVWPTNDKGYGGAKPTDALMCCWMTVEADAVKMATHLIRIAADKNPEWELRLVNCCHDELDATCKEEFAEQAGHAVWLAMQSSLAYFVKAIPAYEDPYSAKNVVCDNWSEK